MSLFFKVFLNFFTIVFIVLIIVKIVGANTQPPLNILVTDAQTFNSPLTSYYTTQVNIPWQSGRVVLAGNPEGTATADVGINLQIMSGSSILFTYRGKCQGSSATEIPMPPLDITHLLTSPSRTLRFEFRKPSSSCTPSQITIGPLYVVHFNDAAIRPKPFLNLPWDYTKKIDGSISGYTFEQAALSMDTFFDHNAPLRRLITGGESETLRSGFLNFAGIGVTSSYSGLDGYGWGARAGVTPGRDILASAGGQARYENSDFCGPAVLINHTVSSIDNSKTFKFQTRYCHVDPVINIPTVASGNFKTVSLGEKIGTLSSNSIVTSKPQLFFVVIWDKDDDSDFEDNLVDGLIDPFGWQGKNSDPWSIYSSSSPAITGNTSYYLFNTTLGDVKINYNTLIDNNFSVGSTSFIFYRDLYLDQNSIFRDTFLKFTHTPRNFFFTNNANDKPLTSAGAVLQIDKNDEFGNNIETFATGSRKYFTFSWPYDTNISSNFAPGTIGLYYSKDGVKWTKEDSSRYLISGNVVSATINHLTQFAVMGEPLDSIAPTTTLKINGNTPQSTYPSQVNLSFETDIASTTLYKITAQSFQKYTTPFNVSEPGNYTLEYFSEDASYNVESLKTFSFTILTPTPTSAPTATPTLTPILTNTPTATTAPTMTPSFTPTPTPTSTPTNTPTATTSITPSSTSSSAVTLTPTPTFTPTPTVIGFSQITKLKERNYKTQKSSEQLLRSTPILTPTASALPIMGAEDNSRRSYSYLIYILSIAGFILLAYYSNLFRKRINK